MFKTFVFSSSLFSSIYSIRFHWAAVLGCVRGQAGKKRMCALTFFFELNGWFVGHVVALATKRRVFLKFSFYFGFSKLLNNEKKERCNEIVDWIWSIKKGKKSNWSYLNLWSRKGEYVNCETNRQSDDGIVVWPMKPISVWLPSASIILDLSMQHFGFYSKPTLS